MDETKEMLKAVPGRLEEIGATVNNLEMNLAQVQGELTGFRRETNDRLERISRRLDYWLISGCAPGHYHWPYAVSPGPC